MPRHDPQVGIIGGGRLGPATGPAALAARHGTGRVIRALPNAAAGVGAFWRSFLAVPGATRADRALARRLFETCGLVDAVVEPAGEGARLFVALQREFEAISEAVGQVRGQPEPVEVTISPTTAVSALWLTPRITAFRKTHPAITVSQIVSDMRTAAGKPAGRTGTTGPAPSAPALAR